MRASDRSDNSVGEELKAEAISQPFTVDNTAPSVESLDLRGETRAALVSGKAEDGQSVLVKVEVAVDDQDWREVTPDSGLADERSLAFHARGLAISTPESTRSPCGWWTRPATARRAPGHVTVPRAR